MTPQLQQIFHSLNELTQSERWQVFDYLVNQLKNSLTRFNVRDRPAPQQPPKRSPQEIFASTQGSWSHQTLDEIDAQLASQLPEYRFEYEKAKPNRFAVGHKTQKVTVVVLDEDVAQVFTTPESVNKVLRALIESMPQSAGGETA